MSNTNFQFFLSSQGITSNTKAVIDCCIKLQDNINCEKHALKSNDVLMKLHNPFSKIGYSVATSKFQKDNICVPNFIRIWKSN